MLRLALPALILLAGCSRAPEPAGDLDSLDRELAQATGPGNVRDPALTAALADQIMVDPALTQSSNEHAIRPAPRPDSAPIPPEVAPTDPVETASLRTPPAPSATCPDCKAKAGTLTPAALAQRQRNPATAGCAARVGYSAAWATRLPDALPLYPGARVTEAAGTDANGCALRIVSFTTGAPPAKAIGFYYTRATAAGFSAEAQAQGAMRVLGGTRGEAAYVIYATPRAGGSEVDLVVNGG